jgi:hypothetical protein
MNFLIPSSASRASACSTEYLPGEPLLTPLFSHPLWRSLSHAASRGAAFNFGDFYCLARPFTILRKGGFCRKNRLGLTWFFTHII